MIVACNNYHINYHTYHPGGVDLYLFFESI
jgi:hypothetical protein